MISNGFESDFRDIQQRQLDTESPLKACLFNLIVISYDLERGLYCQELVRIITERFPCRIISVRAEQDTQYDFIRKTWSTLVVGTEGSRITCDALSIEASTNQLKQVPFLILPNIVPDLPVYIILAHDPTQDQLLLNQIESYANRLIFGTPSVDSMQRFATSVRQMIKAKPIQFIDIAWARSKGWREVLSRVLAEPEKLEACKGATNIHIVYSAQPGIASTRYELQALYLQAWLASRLGWTLLSVENSRATPRITYQTPQGSSLVITFGIQNSDILSQGAIWSIEINGSSEHHFLISHERDSRHVNVHASGPDRCDMPYSIFISNYQRGAALINELFYQPPSDHYLAMLNVFDSEIWNRHALQSDSGK